METGSDRSPLVWLLQTSSMLLMELQALAEQGLCVLLAGARVWMKMLPAERASYGRPSLLRADPHLSVSCRRASGQGLSAK